MRFRPWHPSALALQGKEQRHGGHGGVGLVAASCGNVEGDVHACASQGVSIL